MDLNGKCFFFVIVFYQRSENKQIQLKSITPAFYQICRQFYVIFRQKFPPKTSWLKKKGFTDFNKIKSIWMKKNTTNNNKKIKFLFYLIKNRSNNIKLFIVNNKKNKK